MNRDYAGISLLGSIYFEKQSGTGTPQTYEDMMLRKLQRPCAAAFNPADAQPCREGKAK